MGICRFCNLSAGWFHSVHQACEAEDLNRRLAEEERKRDNGVVRQQLVNHVVSVVKSRGSLVELEIHLLDQLEVLQLGFSDKQQVLVDAMDQLVDAYLDDDLLDPEEESILCEYKERFLLTDSAVDQKGNWTRVLKSGVLRKVMNGELPKFLVEDGFPINFQKGESPVFLFRDVKYLEDVVRRQYQGRSQGVSLRVMKGVYYRVGGFKGEPVFTTERKHVDTGLLVLTDKNVYFWSPSKSLRVPYSKIVTFDMFSDGFGLIRDTATAKPQLFATGDGWFAYNLVVNLAQM